MLRLYRLRFLSPSTPVRAYTLFGAICWAYQLIGGDVEELCERFQENPPFLLSSPFPIILVELGKDCERKEIPLLPKPILPIAISFERNDDICLKVNRKFIKKAQYITLKALEQLVDSGHLEERTFYNEEFEANKEGKLIALKDEEVYKIVTKPTGGISVRNVLNRQTMRSENLFTESFLLFPDMYFLVKYMDENFVSTLETCLELVEDIGLGANKNIGWGKVKITEDTQSFNELVEFIDERLELGSNTPFMSLSPILPTKETFDLEDSFYQVESYKSPVDTTFGYDFVWKKKVLYLKEGSVIRRKQDGYVGQLKDVSAELGNGKLVKAFQYGFEFPVRLEG